MIKHIEAPFYKDNPDAEKVYILVFENGEEIELCLETIDENGGYWWYTLLHIELLSYHNTEDLNSIVVMSGNLNKRFTTIAEWVNKYKLEIEIEFDDGAVIIEPDIKDEFVQQLLREHKVVKVEKRFWADEQIFAQVRDGHYNKLSKGFQWTSDKFLQQVQAVIPDIDTSKTLIWFLKNQ